MLTYNAKIIEYSPAISTIHTLFSILLGISNASTINAPQADPNAPRLLNQVRDKIRLKHYSIRTEQAYTDWVKRFILFHKKRRWGRALVVWLLKRQGGI